jgi:hypothetical protein
MLRDLDARNTKPLDQALTDQAREDSPAQTVVNREDNKPR